jgi:hypothetical protein
VLACAAGEKGLNVESRRLPPTCAQPLPAEYGTARLLALPINDTEEGYDYPARVRWSLVW